MGSFTNGFLIGLGISFLIAPRKGEEMRHLLAESIRDLRSLPPENEEHKQLAQEMSQPLESAQEKAMHAAEMGTTVQDLAQQTVSNAASEQSDLSKKRKHSAQEMSQPLESAQEKAMHAAEMGTTIQDLAQQTVSNAASEQSDLSEEV